MAGEDEVSSTSPHNASMTATNSESSSIINPKSQLITTLLDDTNFLLWKYQIDTAINGYGLEGYIDGTCTILARMIQDPSDKDKLINNKEYINYKRQDKLLASWLLSSISSSVLPQINGCKSAYEIWNKVDQIFSTQSATKIMHYKRQMQTLGKENMSMREYLTKVTTLCDLLATAGHQITETEQILTIMNGLDEQYESVIAVITSKRNLPNM